MSSTTEEVIYYPIAGSPKGGALYLYGEKSAETIIILCGGYPVRLLLVMVFCFALWLMNKMPIHYSIGADGWILIVSPILERD